MSLEDRVDNTETNIGLPVVLKLVPWGYQVPGNCRTRHVTPEGMFVITDAAIETGSEVDVEIQFEGHDRPLTYRAIVVWSRRPIPRPGMSSGVGVRFVFKNEQEKRTLVECLRAAPYVRDGLPCVDRPYRVLVAEDNPHARGLYLHGISQLARLEFHSETIIEITEVCDGREAERTIFSKAFDLLVLDLYMPHLQGDDLVRHLRADPQYSSTPVLIISAGGDENRERALAAGADLYLEKPIVVNDLIGAAKMLLFIDRPRRAES